MAAFFITSSVVSGTGPHLHTERCKMYRLMNGCNSCAVTAAPKARFAKKGDIEIIFKKLLQAYELQCHNDVSPV